MRRARCLHLKFQGRYNRLARGIRAQFSGCPLVEGEPTVLVRMELARIVISDVSNEQIIYLREVEGPRMFPILIGLFEATSIDRRVKGEIPTRPLTHDLLKSTIQELGGEVQDVVINNLEDHTYFAVLRSARQRRNDRNRQPPERRDRPFRPFRPGPADLRRGLGPGRSCLKPSLWLHLGCHSTPVTL